MRELAIRSQVQPAADILRSATLVGAQLVRMEGQIGTITAGAFADLLIVNGNPLDNIEVLTRPDDCLDLVMKAGRIYRQR